MLYNCHFNHLPVKHLIFNTIYDNENKAKNYILDMLNC